MRQLMHWFTLRFKAAHRFVVEAALFGSDGRRGTKKILNFFLWVVNDLDQSAGRFFSLRQYLADVDAHVLLLLDQT